MEQLSPHDASFLYTETPRSSMSGASLAIYDPSTAPDGKVTLKGLMSFIEDRLHLAPLYRRKVVRVPFDLDYPYWVEDEDFDIEFHVRHIALPEPGDWRQLCIQAARLISRPLDPSRPLWEMYVIDGIDGVEGYPPGCFAVLTKAHHAAVDGASGTDLATATQDLSPDAPPPPPPDTPWKGEPVPSDAELLARAGWNNVTRPWEAVRRMTGGDPRERLRELLNRRPSLNLDVPQTAPRTRFNGSVSPHRVVDGVTVSLDDIRGIRALIPGCTVNDVVLAVVGGALRSYLSAKGELPDESLTAMCPISLRTPGEAATGGNQVGAMVVPLHTDVASPRGRLAAVHTSTKAAKEMQEAVGARSLMDLTNFIPSATAALAGRLVASMEIRYEDVPPPYNTVVTNVPGPRQPLYLAGARLVNSYGLGIVHDNMGLMNVVTSYLDQVAMSVTADRDKVPDPAFYVECLRESFDDLKAAAAKVAR